MAQSQHGRWCSCRDCAGLKRKPHREPEPASSEQLRASYESALDELQRVVEAQPELARTEPPFASAAAFLAEAGRRIR